MSILDNPIIKNTAFRAVKKWMIEEQAQNLIVYLDSNGDIQTDMYKEDLRIKTSEQEKKIKEQQKTIEDLKKIIANRFKK